MFCGSRVDNDSDEAVLNDWREAGRKRRHDAVQVVGEGNLSAYIVHRVYSSVKVFSVWGDQIVYALFL